MTSDRNATGGCVDISLMLLEDLDALVPGWEEWGHGPVLERAVLILDLRGTVPRDRDEQDTVLQSAARHVASHPTDLEVTELMTAMQRRIGLLRAKEAKPEADPHSPDGPSQ